MKNQFLHYILRKFVIYYTYIAQAGGGIVADSVPEKEYQETSNKMYSVLKSILIAEAKD